MPGGWSECPTPYEMGFGGDKIGYIIANTYDYAEQSPKCEAPGTKNGPKGAVDPNSFDTQNIIECHQQVVDSIPTAWPLVVIPRAAHGVHVQLLEDDVLHAEVVGIILRLFEVGRR